DPAADYVERGCPSWRLARAARSKLPPTNDHQPAAIVKLQLPLLHPFRRKFERSDAEIPGKQRRK
ncbi:hypothetical protein, partial [Mycobacterium tuberculosis]|uniref:hypothetical protein n=1 Tax=Mycobacterium tuberculosis TaxID=1773 RepID=UPI001BE03DA4